MSKDQDRVPLWRQRLSKTAYYFWMIRRFRVVAAAAETRCTILLGRYLWIAPDKRFALFDDIVLASWRWCCHCCCKLRREATQIIDKHESKSTIDHNGLA
jgi:hypothetical protein